MILFVPQYIVFTTGEARYDTEVDAEAGGVNHHVLLAYVLGDTMLQLLVQVKRTVEEWGAGTSGSVFTYCFDCGFLDSGVVDQSAVAVATEHQDFLAVYDDFGILFGGYCAEIGVNAGGLGLLRRRVFG